MRPILIYIIFFLVYTTGLCQSFEITMDDKTQGYFFNSDGELMFFRDSICVKNGQGQIFTYPIHFKNGAFYADLKSFCYYNESIRKQGFKFIGNITVQGKTDESFVIYNYFKVPKAGTKPYFCIPDVWRMYTTNC